METDEEKLRIEDHAFIGAFVYRKMSESEVVGVLEIGGQIL